VEARPIAIVPAFCGTHWRKCARWDCAARATHGLPKTHLAQVALATAITIVQLDSLAARRSPEQTPTSPFQLVMKQATEERRDFATRIKKGHESVLLSNTSCVFMK
jgi:hypothetical protein